MKAQTATLGYTGYTGLTRGLTRGQVRWAQEHSWFVDWHLRDGILCVLVTDTVIALDGSATSGQREISDWQYLRAWAGY